MAVIAFETDGSFDHRFRNPVNETLGLIQFTPELARRLGTSMEDLGKASFEQQLHYIGQLLDSRVKDNRASLLSLADLCIALIAPDHINRAETTPIFTEDNTPKSYARYAPLDINEDGQVTRSEIDQKLSAYWIDLANRADLIPDFFDLYLNGEKLPLFFFFEFHNGQAYINPEDFSQLGLTVTPPLARLFDLDYVALDQISGLTVHFSGDATRAYFTAQPQLFGFSAQRGAGGAPPAMAEPIPSTLLRYDLTSQLSGRGALAVYASGLLEYSNSTLQAQANTRMQASSDGTMQLDLFGFQGRYHRPKRDALWRFGEQAGFSGPGLNGVGFTGVSYVSDFGFTPNHSHFNTLSFEGATGLPGDVEFYIGEAKIGETISVDRGEFRLEDIPSIDGNGTVSIVLTDKFGRKTTQSIPYFNMPGIYKKGAYEFQYGLGLMSHGRGIYRGLYASSVQRYGLTDRVTASGSLALWPEGAILGAGAQHAWRGKTMINATAAASASATGMGLQVKANLSPAARSETFNWGAQLNLQNHAWRQIGQRPEDAPNFQASIRGFLALNLSEKDTLSTSLMVQKKWDASVATSFSSQWSRALNEKWSLSARAAARSAKLDLSLLVSRTFGTKQVTTTNSAIGENGLTLDVNFSKFSQNESGLSQTYSGSIDQTGPVRFDAKFEKPSRIADHQLRFSYSASATSGYYTRRGVLGRANGTFFAAPKLGQQFAVVTTGEASDIPVYLQSQEVTKTDQNGNAIVPSLRRGKANKISISPEEIPFEYDITNTMVTIYPYPFGASFINLSTRLRRSAIVQLQDASGKVLPAGSEVTFEGAEYPSYVIDFGEVFFEDLPASTTLKVTMGEESCETAIEFPPTDDLQPTLGPFTCS
jgi:outer membrane usher protein